MYQVMKIEDIVSANAKAMVRFMNVTDLKFLALGAVIAAGAYELYLHDKEIKELRKWIDRLERANMDHGEDLLDHSHKINSIKNDLDRLKKDQCTEKEI